MVRTTLADGQPFDGVARGHPHRTHPSRGGTTRRSVAAHDSASMISGRWSRCSPTPVSRFQSSTAATSKARSMRRSNRAGPSPVRPFARPSPRVTCVLPSGPPAAWTPRCRSIAVACGCISSTCELTRHGSTHPAITHGAAGATSGSTRMSATSASWLAAFLATPPAMSGSAHLQGHIAGTVDVPRAQATLDADEVAIEGTSIGRVERRHRTRRQAGSDRRGRAGSRCAGANESGHRQPL